jgi:hypothetical protein
VQADTQLIVQKAKENGAFLIAGHLDELPQARILRAPGAFAVGLGNTGEAVGDVCECQFR